LTSNEITLIYKRLTGIRRRSRERSQQISGNEERRAMLQIHAPMYLQAITAETKNNFLAAGGTQKHLNDTAQNYPASTILY
jgi:hypothetical protein